MFVQEVRQLFQAMRLRRDEAIDMLLYIARRCIPMGLSCIVNEEHSDEIVAVRLFGVAQRDDLPEQRQFYSIHFFFHFDWCS